MHCRHIHFRIAGNLPQRRRKKAVHGKMLFCHMQDFFNGLAVVALAHG